MWHEKDNESNDYNALERYLPDTFFDHIRRGGRFKIRRDWLSYKLKEWTINQRYPGFGGDRVVWKRKDIELWDELKLTGSFVLWTHELKDQVIFVTAKSKKGFINLRVDNIPNISEVIEIIPISDKTSELADAWATKTWKILW